MFPLKPFQKQAIQALLKREVQNVICIAPTGSGKTRIIEVFVQKTKTPTWVLSPLTALNRQHEVRWNELGLDSIIQSFSPESLLSPYFRPRVTKPGLLVFDECHTLLEWGESFRPVFLKVPELLLKHKISKSLWLTATLDQDMQVRLKRKLIGPTFLCGSFDLPSGLDIQTIECDSALKLSLLKKIISYHSEMGIIFVPTRSFAEKVRQYLFEKGVDACFYHAGLSSDERRILETQVKEGKVKVVVATIAFGLGMHFPKLKWGATWSPPQSLLSLTQMVGRVGRSSLNSKFYYLWSKDDFRFLKEFHQKHTENLEQIQLHEDWILRGRPLQELLRFYFSDASLNTL